MCRAKNSQLIDALQAQSESRAQHETFHNLLNRSNEPFSVVAEYFGHGMFNKIFIVNEPDEISQDVRIKQNFFRSTVHSIYFLILKNR